MSIKSKYIVRLDSFQINEENVNEDGMMDFFSGMLDIAGDALQRQVKQKVVAYLLERLGIEEKSKLSRVVQEVVEEIELADYYDIIAGKKTAEYWAPKLAKAFQGFILSEGFNGMAESWGIESTGFLYGTIKEALEEFFSDPNYQKDFANTVMSIISPIMGGETNFSSKSSSADADLKSEIKSFVQDKKPGDKPTKKEAEGIVNSFIKGFGEF